MFFFIHLTTYMSQWYFNYFPLCFWCPCQAPQRNFHWRIKFVFISRMVDWFCTKDGCVHGDRPWPTLRGSWLTTALYLRAPSAAAGLEGVTGHSLAVDYKLHSISAWGSHLCGLFSFLIELTPWLKEVLLVLLWGKFKWRPHIKSENFT